MAPIVFLAVLLAAVLHASWNALLKHNGDKHLGMTAVVLGCTPLAIVAIPFVPIPAIESWPYIAASTAMHFGYQLFLLLSYRIGDLTQVYPIARGVAPMIVAAVSVTILQVELSTTELLAVAAIAAGIISLTLVRGRDGLRNPNAAMLAVVTGCFIAGYSLLDGLGARQAGTAVGYISWLWIFNALFFAIFIRITKPGMLRRVMTEGRAIAIVGGSSSFLAYVLVVWAFTQEPIALVTALRETSIIFALFIGVFFMKERLDLVKVAATALSVFGAILLRVGR